MTHTSITAYVRAHLLTSPGTLPMPNSPSLNTNDRSNNQNMSLKRQQVTTKMNIVSLFPVSIQMIYQNSITARSYHYLLPEISHSSHKYEYKSIIYTEYIKFNTIQCIKSKY